MREDSWLAERFGRGVWWVASGTSADDVRAHAAEHAPAFYQAKVEADDVRSLLELQDAGFRVVDLNLTLARKPEAGGGRPTGIREATDDDRAAVEAIAERDLAVSRFHLDPKISPELAARVKRDWIGAYFEGSRGETVLIAERGGATAGFLAVLATERSRVIDLIAVRAADRGAGIGASLVAALLASAAESDLVEVGTQASNTAATRFYERLGFRLRRARYVLHLHAEGG
jgi:ribosomal protein S18 acetylase RimI-like enzyme